MREIINIESQTGAGDIADSVLLQKVDAALQNTKLLPRTDYGHIAIKSKAGVVTLRGHVGTKANKKRAAHAAACVPGVVMYLAFVR